MNITGPLTASGNIKTDITTTGNETYAVAALQGRVPVRFNST